MIYLTIMPKSATKEPMIEKLKQLQATIGKYAVWEIMIMVAVLLRCMMKSWRPVALPL